VIDVIAGRHGIGMAPASVRFPDEQAGMMGVMWIRRYIRAADVAQIVEAAKIFVRNGRQVSEGARRWPGESRLIIEPGNAAARNRWDRLSKIEQPTHVKGVNFSDALTRA
jgi:hypothetical protein